MIHTLIVSGMTVLIVIAFFGDDIKEKPKKPVKKIEPEYNERTVVLSCQKCRKLNPHIEIEADLFECVSCKRQTDIRVS